MTKQWKHEKTHKKKCEKKGKEWKQTKLIGLERHSDGTGFSSCSNYNKLSSLFLDSICWFLVSVCYIVVIIIVIWIWIGSILNKNKGIYSYLWEAGMNILIRRVAFKDKNLLIGNDKKEYRISSSSFNLLSHLHFI